MTVRDADKTKFFEWIVNCLHEKLQEGAKSGLQPDQPNISGESRPVGPTVNNGPETNPVVLLTASLGGRRQQEMPQERPVMLTQSDEGEDESETEPGDSQDEDMDDDKENEKEPPRKKRKITNQTNLNVSAMEFDPVKLVKQKEGTFVVPEAIASYLDKRMKRCLSKEECEALFKDHPRPDSPSCKVPVVDKYIKEFLGKNFPKEEDSELAKIQAATLLPVCPLASAWNSLLQNGADMDPGMLVPV